MWVLVRGASAQRSGKIKEEEHPSLQVERCTNWRGCVAEKDTALVMDMSWRWVHDINGYNSCFEEDNWNRTLCPDPHTCGQNCAVEGVDAKDYANIYGVIQTEKGITLSYPHSPRLYLTEGKNSEKYKLFQLKNREFTVDIDVSRLPCGMNAALYFSEMPADGGGNFGEEAATPKHGVGYCDARCPHTRFVNGEANIEDWHPTHATTPEGHVLQQASEGRYGSCCAELDIFEGNSRASRFAVHPCSFEGQRRCSGEEECGSDSDEGNPGLCAKNGCSFNAHRAGDPHFYGYGAGFAVDTSRPMTIVTQFLTRDNTDEGDLIDIRRLYVQDGKEIWNSQARLARGGSRSLTEEFCSVENRQVNDASEHFHNVGGLKSMGDALARGMVLSFSVWDEFVGRMLWLDGQRASIKEDPNAPGVARGPCGFSTGSKEDLEQQAQKGPIEVTISNVRYGELGSTYPRGNIALNRDDEGALRAAMSQNSEPAPAANAITVSTMSMIVGCFIACSAALALWVQHFGRHVHVAGGHVLLASSDRAGVDDVE